MLAGQPATEQCVAKNDVNFFNPADVDGPTPPPAGAPNIVMAPGGTQLRKVFEDDGVYAYKYHVDWSNPAGSTFTGPTRSPSPATPTCATGSSRLRARSPTSSTRLDAQGDKLMQRLAYRNFGDHQSLVITHSVNGPDGRGRRCAGTNSASNAAGNPVLYQQSTFAPDSAYRWLGSAAMDGRATSASATRSAARRTSRVSASPAAPRRIRSARSASRVGADHSTAAKGSGNATKTSRRRSSIRPTTPRSGTWATTTRAPRARSTSARSACRDGAPRPLPITSFFVSVAINRRRLLVRGASPCSPRDY